MYVRLVDNGGSPLERLRASEFKTKLNFSDIAKSLNKYL